jgi:NAD(P)H-flavin reductase
MQPREARVAEVEPAGAYAIVHLDGDVDCGSPGQFAMVRDPDGGHYLARPVGLFRRGRRTAMLIDPSYQVGALARARRLHVLGPLGRGFVLDGARPERTLLVAAGIGITVFAGIPAALGGAPRLVAGFRLAEQAAAAAIVDAPAQVAIAPEVVTDGLDLAGTDLVLASGPAAMVRAVRDLAAIAGVPCQVALEAPMACGFGACYGCAVELGGQLVRLCLEGPVVAAERLP